MATRKHETDYVIWQNRAFRFYLAARLLHANRLFSPAAFTGQQALESLLKATLVYWDKTFRPEEARHKFKKMLNRIGNKARAGKNLVIPEYFHAEGRFQSVTRYPSRKKRGVGIPGSFLDDLDQAFHDLLILVPFQFNTELVSALNSKQARELLILRRKNKQMKSLRKFLKAWLKPPRQ